MRNGGSEELIDRTAGCLLGGALGDALGASVEFLALDAICAAYGPRGIEDFAPAYGRLGAISDHTQMTLFTAEGVLRALVRQHEKGICSIPSVIHHAYMRWLLTQGEKTRIEVGTDGWLFGVPELHQRRAPGNTCLTALGRALHFGDAARNESKGCGGLMRVAPIGLIGSLLGSPTAVFELAAETAALTHGNATGYLAAGHLAVIIAGLTAGGTLSSAIEMASRELREHDGSAETLRAVDAALELAASGRPRPTDLERLGGGWVAEEALAISICCALTAESFIDGVRLAVNHSGDSDSTGSITGNLLGAFFGRVALPSSWLESLELRDVIDRIAHDLTRLSEGGDISREDWERYPGW